MSIMSIPRGASSPMVNRPRFGPVKILLTAAVATMIGILHVSSIFPASDPPSYRPLIFGAMAGLIFLLTVGKIGFFSRSKLWMLFLWSGFATVSLISAAINDENLQGPIWMFLGVPYLIFCAFPQESGRYGIRMILSAIVLGLSPYIVWSLVEVPLASPYSGVFANPNAFGMTVVTVASAIFALLRGAIGVMRKSLLQKIWTAGLVLAAGSLLPLILASNSRSSLMTYIVILMVFFGSLFFDARKNRFWIGLSLAAMTGAAVFAASAALLGSPGGSFVNDMLEKFVTKSDDPTDGRIVTWLAVLGDITLVGRGDGAFSGNYGGMAHNTYIEVLGGMGPIALVFILAIHALALYLACRLLFRNIRQDGYAIGPLLVLLNYFVLGLTELVFGLLGNGIHIAFLLMVGVLLNETVSDGADWQFSPSESPQEQMSMQLGSETQ